MRGRHRAPREPRRLSLRHVAAFMAIVVAVVAVPSTANGTETHAKAAARAYADYDDGHRWPVASPVLCIQDGTDGFPVAEAAAEYADFVTMHVQAACPTYELTVTVVTINDTEMEHSGWFDSRRNDDGTLAAGRIRLNLARAYRVDVDGWRVLLVHELGHAVGLTHTEQVESVMHPGPAIFEVGGLSESDREQLADIYGRSQR